MWFASERSPTSVKWECFVVLCHTYFCLMIIKNYTGRQFEMIPAFVHAVCSSLSTIWSVCFKEISQIKSFSIKARWMGYIFLYVIDLEIVEEQQQHLLSLSQPQLFLAITQQEGSTVVFLPNPHCQHDSLIHCLFFTLFRTPGDWLFRFSVCMCLCKGMWQKQKQTASGRHRLW